MTSPEGDRAATEFHFVSTDGWRIACVWWDARGVVAFATRGGR